MRTRDKIAIAAVLVLFCGFFGVMVGQAMDQQDKVDCLTWQQEAAQYPGFFLTQSQEDQCAYWKIKINAPVR